MLKFSPTTTDSTIAPLASPVAAVPTTVDVATVEDARLAAFLDAIVARLRPLPAEFHGEVRRELGLHLDSLIAAHEELGATRDAAIDAAMAQFGDGKRIAWRYRQAWRQTEAREGLLPTMRFTLATFSVALTIMLAYVAELKVIEELVERHGRLSPAESLLLALMWWFIFGLPVISGTWVGWRSPRHAASGAFFALAILTLLSVPFLGMQMAGKLTDYHSLLQLLCSTIGQIFLLWLPIGWFSAAATGFARKPLQRRRA